MTAPAPVRSVEVRGRLVDALRLDLVGPDPYEPADARLVTEVLPESPSQWYLTGFLAPIDAPESESADDDASDDLEGGGDDAAADEPSSSERQAARRVFFPSSMGLSFLVPAACASADSR